MGETGSVILCTRVRTSFLLLRGMRGGVGMCLTLTQFEETRKEIPGNDTRHGVTPKEMAHAERALAWTEPS